jgi:hypothetical protein
VIGKQDTGRSGPLSREGSLLCHTCCDTGPRFFRSHPRDRPNQSPLTTRMEMQRTYSNPDPHGGSISEVTLIAVSSLVSNNDRGLVEHLLEPAMYLGKDFM